MKVNDIVNRLKDTRGYLNEQIDEHCDEDEMGDMSFMLDGVESAIQFFEEWLLTNEDFTD
jgi:hypothetical protein